MLDGRAPKGITIKNTVYLLVVLTIVLLAGLIVFFASISVYWPKEPVATEPQPSIADQSLMNRLTQWAFFREGEPFAGEDELETAVLPTSTPLPNRPTYTPTPQRFGTLIIPDIEVDQPIVPIFVRDGQWDISEIGNQIGHLETTGRYPHDQWAMTFTAHVTLPWPEIEGPFANLIFLERGEEIIYRWQGVDYIYEVERIFRVSPDAVDLLYDHGGDKLLLVTCSGWDFNDRQYAERLVTRAVLVREEVVTQYGQ